MLIAENPAGISGPRRGKLVKPLSKTARFKRFSAPARFSAQDPSLSRPRRLHPHPASVPLDSTPPRACAGSELSRRHAAGYSPGVIALAVFLSVFAGCDAADTLTEDFKDSLKSAADEVESASQKAGDEVQKFGEKVGNGAEKFSDELKK